jgi:hypothetical protein
MVANRQALEESLVGRQAQQVTQVGLTHQDKGGQGLTIHLVGNKQAKLLKSVGWQKMRLINDQQGEAALALGQVGQGSADGGHLTRTAERGLMVQRRQNVAVEAGDPDRWIWRGR